MSEMTVQPPKYQNWLSAGNILTILFGAVTAVAMFIIMDERGKDNAEDIVNIRSERQADILRQSSALRELRNEIEENQDRINDLRLNDARLFEKLDSIYVAVSKIEAYVDGRPYAP
jgi:predicted nuclease with TOPRIM domain